MHSSRFRRCLGWFAFSSYAFLAGPAPLMAADAGPAKRTLFVCGDSTARNTAKGKSGEPCAGWGTPLADYFDAAKVTVANVAHAGQSSRTYYNLPGDWPSVLPKITAGDFVLLVFRDLFARMSGLLVLSFTVIPMDTGAHDLFGFRTLQLLVRDAGVFLLLHETGRLCNSIISS